MKWENLTYQHVLTALCVLLLLGISIYGIASPWLSSTVSNVETEYGRRSGINGQSVNGTAVFAEMFRQQGASVKSWSRLSPRLSRSDVIVWVPNSFELPSVKETDHLDEEWLRIEDDRFRTLIYVARDFDAAVEYWRQQRDHSAGTQWIDAQSNFARAQSDHAFARSLTGTKMECKWFSIESDQYFQTVTPSDGPWAQVLDRENANIPVAGKLIGPDEKESANLKTEILLGSEETPLVMRIVDEYYWPESQILVLLNGASVLNLPLVDHQNRMIAAKLVKECRDTDRVTFLETGPAGAAISSGNVNSYSGFEALTVWPINSILMHLIVAGILFCAMVFPIFGKPRNVEESTPSDFGKHIRAMGDLLSISGDRQAAMAKVQAYRNLKVEPISSDSGAKPQEKETGNPFKVSQA